MTFEEEVNEVVSKATVDEKGNLQLPDGLEAKPEVLYAAKLEKRHRDTQGSYTKSQQQIKLLQAENAKLAEQWEQDAMENLTAAEKSKLQELKVQDTDAYIKKVGEIKQEAKVKFDERRTNLSKEVNQLTELQTREILLEEYNNKHPDAQITDEVITNDVPPRIVKKLEKGEVTFEEFLIEANRYITTPKSIKKDEELENGPNLDKAGGSDTPSDKALSKKSSSDYSQEIF